MTILAGNVDGKTVSKKNRETVSELGYHYEVYGIGLRTGFPLNLPERSSADLIQMEVQLEPEGYFSDLLGATPLQRSPHRNFYFAHLEDGSSYVQWEELGEFLVSADGLQIHCRRFEEVPKESFQVYLLGQALSFALVKSGFEPLHATGVVIDGQVVALLGDSGYGKSSLAACFLEDGHHLLTDDLLVLKQTSHGFQAYPGPPRIKLFDQMARRFLGESARGVAMNSTTLKLVMPLGPGRICSRVAPLAAFFAIAAPHDGAQQQGVRIDPVSSKEGFVLLMNNVFNYVIVDSKRLDRQFNAMAALAEAVPMKRVFYPRLTDTLPLVRDAIVAELRAK